MNQLSELKNIVKGIVGNEYLYFDTAVLIKKTPHTPPVTAWGICVSPSNKLYIMDNSQQWHELAEPDTLIIPSLYQRIKSIESKYSKTA